MRASGLVGFVTFLLLVAAVVIVVIAGTSPGGAEGLWARLTGRADSTAAVSSPGLAPLPSPQPMSTQGGMETVDRLSREMEAMDDLSRSVGR